MEARLVYVAAVLGLGLLAQWMAWRVRLPAILLLLLFGFGLGLALEPLVENADPEALLGRETFFAAISISVAIILFEGGLSLRLREIRQTGRAVFRLVTVGIVLTWLLTTAAARYVLGLEPAAAALLGAILVVSGPTVIIPLLRQVRPNRRVGSVVKWEGIVNDPIGALLAVLVFEAVLIGGFREAATATLAALGWTLLVGCLGGAAAALVMVQMLRRYWIPDYLENLAFLTAVVLVFTASNLVQPESGLVTVTVFGILLANQKVTTIRHVVEFKENLRVLLISCLFIVLASRIRLSDMLGLGVPGIAFLALMLLAVRPATVMLSTLGTELTWRERMFLAWMAPRGIVAAAVSSIFAVELAARGTLSPEMAASVQTIVPATFLVIVGTVAVYGATASPLAAWLGIAQSNPQGILFAGADPFVRAVAKAVHDEGVQVLLVDTNHQNIQTARMSGLPTVWASVLSEYVREEVDFGGIGRLLAMTPNDEVNTLAAQEFDDFFGRAGVYQLPTRPSESERREAVSAELRGRPLFAEDCTFSLLSGRLAAGAVIKKTPLTDEFDYVAFREHYGPSAVVLFVLTESGRLNVATADTPPEPEPGQKLISLVEEESG